MSLLRVKARQTTPSVSIVDDVAELDVFRQPGCAAVVWRRQMPLKVQSWLNDIDPEVLPSGRVVLPASHIAQTVSHLCDMSGLPQGAERAWLEQDITALAKRFSDLMASKFLRLRLDVVTSDSCRKFHIDAITGRMICTYRGTGTQYGLSIGGRDPERVFTVQTGAPILLRGTHWPAHASPGLLHRSPPIEGSGATRLLLVLDPIHDPEDAE